MKDKFSTISKVLVIIIICLLLCFLMMHLIDSRLNGIVGDWFVDKFINFSEWHNDTDHYYRETLDWPALKECLTLAAIGIFTFFIITSIIFFLIGRYSRRKAVIREIAKLMRDYILLNETSILSRKEYKDVEIYLSEIKKQQQVNEHLVIEEVNKKNELITYLAHDLKTPLTSVIGYLSLLEEAEDLSHDQQLKYIQISRNKALRLEELINEFFDITRYNLNEVVLEKEKINLSLMLNQLAEEFYPIVTERGNSVLVAAEDNLMILADPDKLARVFNNILKNAIAYSYPNTEIRISANKDNDHLLVSFTNMGKTIPTKSLDAIFEKFYRLDSARSSSTGGAGLGLAIAKEIIIRHGGRIAASSANNMTTFTIELPMCDL